MVPPAIGEAERAVKRRGDGMRAVPAPLQVGIDFQIAGWRKDGWWAAARMVFSARPGACSDQVDRRAPAARHRPTGLPVRWPAGRSAANGSTASLPF